MSRLGHYLVQEGILSQSDRLMIKRESAANHGSFARSILALGVLDEDELSALFASKTSFRQAAKDILKEIDRSLKGLIPNHILAWLEVVPLSKVDGQLTVAMVDPTDLDVIHQLAFFTGLRIRPVIATRSAVMRGLGYYGARLNLGESRFESFIKNHGRKTQAIKVAASNQYLSRQPEQMADDQELDRRMGAALDRNLSGRPAPAVPTPASESRDSGDGSDADLDSLEAELRAEGQVDSGMEAPPTPVAEEPPAGADLNDEALAAAAPDEPLDEANIGLEVDIPIDFLDDNEIAAKAASANDEATDDMPAAEETKTSAAGLAAGGGLFDMDESLDFDSPADQAPSEPSPTNDATINELEPVQPVEEPTTNSEMPDGELEGMPEESTNANSEIFESDSGAITEPEDVPTELPADVEAQSPTEVSVEAAIETDLESAVETQSEISEDSPRLDEEVLDVGSSDTVVMDDAIEETQPAIDPMNDESQDLIDVQVSEQTDLTPEPVVGDLKASASHSGVAVLNKVMVQLQIMTSRKKAMDKMAEAAVKVGIPSGLVMSMGDSGPIPGIMWDSNDGKVATAEELPTTISEDFIANLKSSSLWGAGWVSMDQALQSHQREVLDVWPEVTHRPNYICGWDGGNLSHIGFANFNQENDHEGLKSTFAEVLRAVSAKP